MLILDIFSNIAKQRPIIKTPTPVNPEVDTYWDNQRQWDENPAGGIPFETLMKEVKRR